MGTRHHDPRGTNADQVRFLMKRQWELYKRSEFTVEELLDLWNSSGNTAKTKKQLVNTISTLSRNGTLINIVGGSGHTAKYVLTNVLDEMTKSGNAIIVPDSSDSIKDSPTPVEKKENSGSWNEVSAISAKIDALMKSHESFKQIIETVFDRAQGDINSEDADRKKILSLTESIDVTMRAVILDIDTNTKTLEEVRENLDRSSTHLNTQIKAVGETLLERRDNTTGFDREAYMQGFKDGWTQRGDN